MKKQLALLLACILLLSALTACGSDSSTASDEQSAEESISSEDTEQVEETPEPEPTPELDLGDALNQVFPDNAVRTLAAEYFDFNNYTIEKSIVYYLDSNIRTDYHQHPFDTAEVEGITISLGTTLSSLVDLEFIPTNSYFLDKHFDHNGARDVTNLETPSGKIINVVVKGFQDDPYSSGKLLKLLSGADGEPAEMYVESIGFDSTIDDVLGLFGQPTQISQQNPDEFGEKNTDHPLLSLIFQNDSPSYRHAIEVTIDPVTKTVHSLYICVL